MSRWMVPLGVVLFVLFAPLHGHAQERSGGGIVGQRIRVELEGPRTPFGLSVPQVLRGTATGIPGDTLVLALKPGAGTARIPVSAIHELRVSQGPRSRWVSAFHQGLQGAAFGALVASLSSAIQDGEDYWTLFGAGAGIGAAAGAVEGALAPGERWDRVPVPE